ncbi:MULTISPECIES: sulfotransferase [unclassified Crossiella]|uniref:sulfotransferase family protein n=1 Tax=unclassified Crossiella TaxID=2620835 RepID=UPI001FFE8F80|nr:MULTISPECIES: sulfotransferase [unclassified Crossiella]MCK2244322.1 sulfotransferase [Crossiella sp. S99.2]MCK2257850.1 sulfotransferase [Crossiella sp. S99.1]
MSTRPLFFVVGTGRTGSTVVSRILNRHPEVLSLNELFVSLGGRTALPGGVFSGAEFWRLLSDPHPVFNLMLQRGAPLPEFLYQNCRGRYSPAMGVPAISLMTLPHLTDDPDRLLDDLGRAVPLWPVRPVAEHHRALFAMLADRFGRRVVVERSGHSLDWVPALRAAFPAARFIHMYRDGLDCALSMSRHAGYRSAALATEILDLAGVSRFSELTEQHLSHLPEDLARLCIEGFELAFTLDRPIPVQTFGRLWSTMLARGLPALAEIPHARLTTLRYEDLLADPSAELSQLAGFLGVEADACWLDTAADLLSQDPVGKAAALPPAELAALRNACASGMRLLGEPVRS